MNIQSWGTSKPEARVQRPGLELAGNTWIIWTNNSAAGVWGSGEHVKVQMSTMSSRKNHNKLNSKKEQGAWWPTEHVTVQMSATKIRWLCLYIKTFYYIRSVFEENPQCKHTMWKDNNGGASRINWRQRTTLDKFSEPFPHFRSNLSLSFALINNSPSAPHFPSTLPTFCFAVRMLRLL